MNENDTPSTPAPGAPVMTLAQIGEEVKRWCAANLHSIHYATLIVQHLDGASCTQICVVPPPDRPDVLAMRELRKLGITMAESDFGHVVSGFGLRLGDDDQDDASARVTFTNAGEVVGEFEFPAISPRGTP